MIVQPYHRITRDQLGKEVPEWVDVLLDTIQPQIEKLTQVLRGNLTVTDNLKAETFWSVMTSGEEKTFRAKNSPAVVFVGQAKGKTVTGLAWRIVDKERVAVTVTFSGGGSADTRLVLMAE